MNDIRAEVSKVLESLSSKKELNAQEKRDYMLIDIFLRGDNYPVVASAIASQAEATPYTNAENSINTHVAEYVSFKKMARGGNATAAPHAIQQLKLLALEINDLIAEVGQHTESEEERRILKSISFDL